MKQLIRRLSWRVTDSLSLYTPLRSRKDRQRITVSEGHVPVYVGEEKERFEIRTELLGHPIFLELLRKSAQEYGYDQQGALRIPCPVLLFERVLGYLAEFDGCQEIDEVVVVILRLFYDG